MDITERKQAEEALLLKDSALTSSANAVVINGLDGRAFYFNDSFLAMCGYTREEASRLTVFDLYTQEGNQRAFTELNTRGYFIGEGVARRKDGSAFPVAISASTIKDANGRPISTMSSFVDISTRKKAEAELRASEGRFRSLFDNMTEGVALHETVYDEHGAAVNYRLLDVNRQYEILIDLKRDQVAGKLATEVYQSEVAPFLEEFTQVGETGRPHHFETYYAPIKKQLDISVAPLGPGRWATIFSDVTARKRTEQAMRLNAERVQVLLKLNQMTDATLQQITDFALEEAVRITRSQMGYLAFVNDDETVLTMHAWSKQAMKECAVINKPVDYVLSETGLWGEAVRQRRPIITNDYAAPNPAKKGHPAGHVPVRRHMNVPVFAGKHIVLVAGVGNKEDEYDNTDAEQLTLLMEGMWRLIERLRSEEALRESELFLREAQSIGRIGGWKANPETGYVEWTEGIYHMFEVPLDHKPDFEEGLKFFLPQYIPMIRERLQRTLTTGEPFQMECEVVTATGKRLQGELRGLPHQSTVGKAPCVMGTFQDISKRKRSEEALRESELFLRETQTIGRIGGWKANPETDYLEWTEGIYRLIEAPLDYKPGLSEGLKSYLPQYIPIIREQVQRTLTTGEPFQMECEVVTTTGKHLWAELCGLTQSGAGEAPYVVGTLQDITRRKQAEEALRENELFLRESQIIGRIGGWKTNPETDYLECTEGIYRIIGVPLDYKPGFTEGLKFFMPQYVPVIRERLMRTLTAGEPFQMECEITTAAGKHLWAELRGLAQGVAGKTLCVIGTLQDITERKRAEEVLRQSEESLRQILESVGFGILIVGKDKKVRQANHAALEMIGLGAEAELKGHVCHETICPANCDKCPILDLGQKLDKSERVLVHKNGSRVPILKSVTPITLGGEEVLLESFVDITERKQAEEALSAQQRQLIDIIEFLPDATLAIDKEGRVIIWNKAVEEMTGIPAAEMIGKAGYAHTMAFHEEAKPQLVDLALESHEEIVSRYSKITREGDTLAAEVFCRGLYSKKGAWVFAKASPLHDQSGNVVGAIESVRDITRRKQAEEELQFRNVLLLTQQEASIEGSLVVDEESRILTYNRRFVEMWGVPAKLLEGGNDEQVLQFVTTQLADPGAFYQRVQYLYEHRHETSRDELILADGRVFDRYSAPMFGPEERYYGRVWYFRDITDRKRAEQEMGRLNADMAHKNRELQNILFAASHDLRSPLLNIHGFGKRLEDACAELRKVVDQPDAGAAELQKIAPLIREGMPKALGFIRSGAARMDTLISGMLRLSRLGRVEMRFELLDIAKLVAEVVNSMASEIQSAGGTVCAVSLPACHGDAVLISQVFANLIENAIKYRDPARPIRVEVSGCIKDADALYCVADNGIGVAAADQERIWNLFCRLNPAATDGEGLGLNLVRRIVERHNGRVWVESVPGTGSKFYVALPTEKTVPS
ncbi:MAG: PAS domain S-box protein [Verrucomicrobiia bacterium]